MRATVWQDTVEPPILAALDPGVPADLDRTPDVLVVGGGAVGLATAAACVRAGLGSVLLIERDQLSAGASGGAAAALSPDLHVWTDPPAFVQVARASLARYRDLDREWDGALGLVSSDWLVLLAEPLAASARDLGVEVLDAEGVSAAEPSVAGVGGALLVRDQARVHALRLAAALARHAGTVATGVAMLGLDEHGGRVRGVRTSAGDVSPGAVVFATGLAPEPWVKVPQRLVKGHLIATAPLPSPLRHSLAATWGLVLQLEDGRLVAGGTLDEEDDTPDPRDEVLGAIRADLHALLPGAADVAVTHGWCCFRPATADRLPVIDRVPELANAWVTAGHYRTGILLAPAVGDALAEWIRAGHAPAAMASFSLARFR